MSRRFVLENGEKPVISVTLVPRGLAAPVAVLVLVEALVVWLSTRWGLLHRHEAIAIVAVGAIPTLVVLTRSWRWRSHKIFLTSQRIVVEGGVLGRRSTQIHLSDVFATHANQSFAERLRRRGVVIVETSGGSVVLGPVRHPAALRRLVDRARRDRGDLEARSWDEWFHNPDIELD